MLRWQPLILAPQLDQLRALATGPVCQKDFEVSRRAHGPPTHAKIGPLPNLRQRVLKRYAAKGDAAKEPLRSAAAILRCP